MKRKNLLSLILLITPIVISSANLKLWYNKPATIWQEALPVGNGRMGAMVYGGIGHEQIQLNENTVWGGSPYNNYEFKTLSSGCSEFKITGSAAYNKDTSSIYISNIDYCDTDNTIYDDISCSLYETVDNKNIKISDCTSSSNINLTDYLKDVTINVEKYNNVCKNFSEADIYLEISATKDNKTTTYKAPLELNNNCN